MLPSVDVVGSTTLMAVIAALDPGSMPFSVMAPPSLTVDITSGEGSPGPGDVATAADDVATGADDVWCRSPTGVTAPEHEDPCGDDHD